ncbi:MULTISPECIES: TetR/AcrR family transcriptional regulator [Frigidibacter]|uniref:TetR family transcriptional regulator n=1 Tax=Frigidibacter mobilis TaxID=1335048 RepID=A0A165SP41_9RHOB|nr:MULTISPECIES: TetR/AcrR family transcriptional regulator [Frigidibacter]AMY69789.1 TetR family transcriptional regulator [Frigidibacter mobilis]MDP3340445.1 TetR/AcrR family transcriptional regulator [Frigidibacter sp.]
MSSDDLTEPRLSDRKVSILEAAAALFAKHGYAGVSIRDLAREIHTTPAALYHHFPDKDAIYAAALRHVFSDRAKALETVVKGDDAPDVTLERLIVWLTQQFSDNPVVARLVQRELLAGDRDRLRLLTEDVMAAPFREIERLMHRLAPTRDASLSAASIIALVMGYVQLTPVLEVLIGERNTQQRLRDFAAHTKDMVLRGLLAQPQPGVHI